MHSGRHATAPLDRFTLGRIGKGAENFGIIDKPRVNDTHRRVRGPGQFVEPSPRFPADGEGFEPPVDFAYSGFQDRRLDHSATHPDTRIPTGYCRVLLAEPKPTTPRKPRPVPTVPSYAGLGRKRVRSPLRYFGKAAGDPEGKAALDKWLAEGGALYGTHGKTLPARRPDMENASRTTETSTGVCGGTAEARERLRQPLTELRRQGGSRLRRDMGEEGIVKKWERTPPRLNGIARIVQARSHQRMPSSPRVPCVSRRIDNSLRASRGLANDAGPASRGSGQSRTMPPERPTFTSVVFG